MKIYANDIVKILRNKHRDDLCVSECKTGPTMTAQHLRIDFLAMKRSWVNWNITAYEIKTNRSDFLGDDKWPGYLDYCHQFYFICPSGVIKPEEVSGDAGLMYISKTGTRIFTKKKAPFRRQQEIPQELLIYILMCRAKVGTNIIDISEEHRVRSGTHHDYEYWKKWLEQKDESKELGYNVSRKIRELVKQRIDDTHRRNERLENENKDLQEFKAILKKLGFSLYNIESKYGSFEKNLKAKIEQIGQALPDNLIRYLDNTIRNIEDVKVILNNHMEEK